MQRRGAGPAALILPSSGVGGTAFCRQFAVVAAIGVEPKALNGAAFVAAAQRAPTDPKVAMLKGRVAALHGSKRSAVADRSGVRRTRAVVGQASRSWS